MKILNGTFMITRPTNESTADAAGCNGYVAGNYSKYRLLFSVFRAWKGTFVYAKIVSLLIRLDAWAEFLSPENRREFRLSKLARICNWRLLGECELRGGALQYRGEILLPWHERNFISDLVWDFEHFRCYFVDFLVLKTLQWVFLEIYSMINSFPLS